jgi:predicted dehydrogenase
MTRVILAGLGSMGSHWLRVLADHPDVEMAGYVETDAGRREAASLEHGLARQSLFATLEDALAASDAQAVVDVTPPSAHVAVSGAALRAGRHVLTEKPLAPSLVAARALADLGRERGLVHMVAQNYRFSPGARTIRRLIAEGRIGRVGSVAIRFAVGGRWQPTDFRLTMEQPLVLDMSIHHMDLLRACLGGDPLWVQASTWSPAGSWYRGDAAAAASFGFADGLVAAYHGNWAAVGDQTTWNGTWHIEGEEGGLIWERDRLYLARGQWTEGSREEVPLDAHEANGQRAVLDAFLAAIATGALLECSARDNLASLGMVFGIVDAARTGQRIPLT